MFSLPIGKTVGLWRTIFPEDAALMVQAIKNGTATMISDGSYKLLL
jgi:hypothetical protein